MNGKTNCTLPQGGGKIINGNLTYGKALNEDIPAMTFIAESVKIETILDVDKKLSATIHYYNVYVNPKNNTILNIYNNTGNNGDIIYLYKFDDDTNNLTSIGSYTLDKYEHFNTLHQGNKLFFNKYKYYLPITDTSIGEPITTQNVSVLSDISLIDNVGPVYEDYMYGYSLSYNGANKKTYYKIEFNNNSFSNVSSATINIDNEKSCIHSEAGGVVMRLEYYSTGGTLSTIRYYDFNTDSSSVNYIGYDLKSTNIAGQAINKNDFAVSVPGNYGFDTYVINKNTGIFRVGNGDNIGSSIDICEIQRLSDKLFIVCGSKGACVYAKNTDYSWSKVYEIYENLSNFMYLNGKFLYTSTSSLNLETMLSKSKLITGYIPANTFIEGVNIDKLITNKEGRIYTL